MKNILVTTDFSKTADNALDYAVQLAITTGASITLFHVYHIPVMVSDAPVITAIPLDEIDKESLNGLRKIQSAIIKNNPTLKVSISNAAGFANDEINELANSERYDLVIMGIKGGGKFVQLLGSTATSVAKHSKAPVLIIPSDAKYKKLEKIVFAFDYQEIKDAAHINMLIEFTKSFNAKILVLNIVEEHKRIPLERALAGMQVDHILEETNHVLSFPKDSDVAHGIDHYIEKHHGDMLVMIKRKHGLFDYILHGSHTKEMAFHTHIPLLVLND